MKQAAVFCPRDFDLKSLGFASASENLQAGLRENAGCAETCATIRIEFGGAQGNKALCVDDGLRFLKNVNGDFILDSHRDPPC